MKYERFEQLPVWQAAAALAARTFPWSRQPVFQGMGDLTEQLQRAALSVSNNIAEGFERGTTAELLTFLYYARGSAGEVRSMLCVMEQMSEFATLQPDIQELKQQSESISRQNRAWAGNLQNSEIPGTRHLNDRSKKRYENRLRQTEYYERMDQFMKQKERELKQEQENRRAQS